MSGDSPSPSPRGLFSGGTSRERGTPGIGLVDEWSRGAWERVEGFKIAAQVLTDAAKHEQEPVIDWLIYPILYVYRHVIELRLKYAIADGQAFVGDSKLRTRPVTT